MQIWKTTYDYEVFYIFYYPPHFIAFMVVLYLLAFTKPYQHYKMTNCKINWEAERHTQKERDPACWFSSQIAKMDGAQLGWLGALGPPCEFPWGCMGSISWSITAQVLIVFLPSFGGIKICIVNQRWHLSQHLFLLCWSYQILEWLVQVPTILPEFSFLLMWIPR